MLPVSVFAVPSSQSTLQLCFRPLFSFLRGGFVGLPPFSFMGFWRTSQVRTLLPTPPPCPSCRSPSVRVVRFLATEFPVDGHSPCPLNKVACFSNCDLKKLVVTHGSLPDGVWIVSPVVFPLHPESKLRAVILLLWWFGECGVFRPWILFFVTQPCSDPAHFRPGSRYSYSFLPPFPVRLNLAAFCHFSCKLVRWAFTGSRVFSDIVGEGTDWVLVSFSYPVVLHRAGYLLLSLQAPWWVGFRFLNRARFMFSGPLPPSVAYLSASFPVVCCLSLFFPDGWLFPVYVGPIPCVPSRFITSFPCIAGDTTCFFPEIHPFVLTSPWFHLEFFSPYVVRCLWTLIALPVTGSYPHISFLNLSTGLFSFPSRSGCTHPGSHFMFPLFPFLLVFWLRQFFS